MYHVTMTRHIIPIEDRFWKRVQKTETCWLWVGAKTFGGYGVIRSRENKIVRSHRLSWEIHYGKIPDGLDVCHHCDVPSCVRPDHLFVGTPQDNYLDMHTKGRDISGLSRRVRGVKHHFAKLTPEIAKSIRDSYGIGDISLNGLAIRHGVSKKTILNIVKNRIWVTT